MDHLAVSSPLLKQPLANNGTYLHFFLLLRLLPVLLHLVTEGEVHVGQVVQAQVATRDASPQTMPVDGTAYALDGPAHLPTGGLPNILREHKILILSTPPASPYTIYGGGIGGYTRGRHGGPRRPPGSAGGRTPAQERPETLEAHDGLHLLHAGLQGETLCGGF